MDDELRTSVASLRSTRLARLGAMFRPRTDYQVVRFLALRLLGVVHVATFAGAFEQAPALLGERGLTPAARYVASRVGSGASWLELPTLFRVDASDDAIRGASLAGVVLGLALTCGLANVPLLLALAALQLSFLSAGQFWFGYGWELLLFETTVLAALLVSPLDPRPRTAYATPLPSVFLLRWLALRVHLGAGLIKWKADGCWTDFTCLDFHFETQPLPNPLSPLFHAAPHELHVAGVALNHVVELVLPFFVFGPRRLRLATGVGFLVFQGLLILSGNLSFFNWLTIVPALFCFDDAALARVLPRWFVRALDVRAGSDATAADSTCGGIGPHPAPPAAYAQRARIRRSLARLGWAFVLTVYALLSIDPVRNLFAERQIMNGTFTAIPLVNTYGAFGSVGRERLELVIEGTLDEPGPNARWEAYELPCKPGAVDRPLCVLGPYQHRLDWQLWFAAMTTPGRAPYAVALVAHLLAGDRAITRLFAHVPFGGRTPRYVRVLRYTYRFAPIGSGAVWTREPRGTFLAPIGQADTRVRDFLRRAGIPLPDDTNHP